MPNENIIDTATTDEMIEVIGICFKDGGKTYYIKEITAPSGYVLNKTVYSVTIEAGVDVVDCAISSMSSSSVSKSCRKSRAV